MPSNMSYSAPSRPTAVSSRQSKHAGRPGASVSAAPAVGTAATRTRPPTSTASAAASAAAVARVQVSPPVAEFINYDVDTTYIMPLEVRNCCEEILTLRFVAPTAHPAVFRLLNPSAVRVAPGLKHTLEVEFSTHRAEDYEDSLAILSNDGGRVEVQLSACQVPQLEFPPLIDFGKVEQQSGTPVRTLTLINRGRKGVGVSLAVVPPAGKSSALAPPRGITLSSATTVVPAQSCASVTVELNTLAPGVYRWGVAVEVDGRRLPAGLEVAAEVLDCRSRLIDPATSDEVVSLEFPETFAGNKKVRHLEVVNGGSQAISFAIQAAHNLSDDGVAPFQFSPSEGRLPPQGRLRVTAVFCPPLQERRTGWSATTSQSAAAATATAAASSAARADISVASTRAGAADDGEGRRYEALYTLLFVETEQTQSFRLAGSSCETVVFLSTSAMEFGTCLLKGSAQLDLTITNGVSHLPMRYELRPPSHFTVRPARGTIGPGGAAQVAVEYHPHRLGPYEEPLTLLANSTVSRVVTLRGNAVHRLPSSAAAAAMANTAARTARREQASAESAAAAAVDLGMVPGEGLRPPVLPRQVPPGVLRAEETAARTRQGSHVAPPVFGVRSLVKRRFHSSPSTAHERQDCRRELTPTEVLNVVLPLKAIDFGRVTVHADVIASLYVYNGTKAAILAAVPTDADGLVSLDPPSQVVPPQRMAQFDVHLCSRTVQAFQQVMRVAVNQQHFMRFNVQADVVPVEVTVSQREVRMALMGQSEEPVCTAQVTLGNGGNCAAAYRWHLSNDEEFDVEPRTGLLEAGGQRSTVFRFCPAVGTTQVTCEARLEVEGAVEDKVLPLIGSVAPAKCVWAPTAQMAMQDATAAAAASASPSTAKESTGLTGVLPLGRIAAGVPTVGTLAVANKGKTNAYFAMSNLPAWLTVTPSQGRVCAGETEELTVCVRHHAAGSVSHVLECAVVGMRRPLTCTVKATVVAPPLVVLDSDKEQSEVLLRFGEVFVGCPQTRAIVLRNAMDVAAAVKINLEACGHFMLVSPALPCEDGELPVLSSNMNGGPETMESELRRSRVQSRLQSRLPSLRAASASEGTLAAATATAAAVTPRPRCSSMIVVPPHADYALCLSYNPTRAAHSSRCAVRWLQIGADDLHPLPPFMLEAAARAPPVVLSAASLSFAPVVVGQRPPSQVVYVRRGRARGLREREGREESGVAASSTSFSVTMRQAASWRLQLRDAAHRGSVLIEPSRGVMTAVDDEQAVTLTFLSACAGELQDVLELKTGNDASSDAAEGGGEVEEERSDVAPCAVCAVTASAIDPRVRSSTNAVMFPVVPLGVAVQTTVLLHNEGYDTVCVEYTGSSAPPLEVAFPEGGVMTAHPPRDTLPVTLTFCSLTPITVRSSIRLTTNTGGSIDIAVFGSAINSIVATEPFVSFLTATPAISATADTPYTWVVEELVEEGPGSVPRITCHLPLTDESAQPSSAANPHELVDHVEAEVPWEAETEWLTEWWNVHLGRSPVHDIVEALQQSRGGLLLDAIELLTGKRPRRTDPESTGGAGGGGGGGGATAAATAHPTTNATARKQRTSGVRTASKKTSSFSETAAVAAAAAAAGDTSTVNDAAASASSPPPPPPQPLPKELRALDMVVSHLRSCGGCLSDVELPYLLPFDVYLEYMADYHCDVIEREVQQLEAGGSAAESVLAAAFQRRSAAAWLTVLRECLRLFYVSQVRLAPVSAPAEVRDCWAAAPFRRTLGRSAVYSEEESTLLRWVEVSMAVFAQTGPDSVRELLLSVAAPQRLEDVRDARLLLAVVLAYVPACAAQIRTGLMNAAAGGNVATAQPAAVASVLMRVLTVLGVPGLPTSTAFVTASPTYLVLLLTDLYLYLPKYAASTAVHLVGRALTKLSETISIDNASAEPRHYRVLLPDNSPFQADAEELVVGPRGSGTLTLSVVPRTQRKLAAQCLLVDDTAQVRLAERTPFVFALHAAPTVEPLQTTHMHAPLYEATQSELFIENPFSVNCVVSLRVSQTRLRPSAVDPREAAAAAMPWRSDEAESHWRSSHDAPFVVTSDVLSLRQGESTRLPFSFLPLSRGTYRLLLTFHEETEGEFTYAVEATCGWPKPTEAGVELRVEQGERCSSALTVKCGNAALERCLKVYEDRAHRPQRTDLSHLLSGATYAVHFVNEQMEGPNPFFAADSATYTAPANGAAFGTLPFTFTPQSVGVYTTYALLISAVDTRLLRLSGECVPKGDRRELHFLCPARQSIAQQITLHNHSSEDWLVAATLEGSPHFSGPHDVRVPSGRSKEYTVKYAPTWIMTEDETAVLVLLNSTTGQKHTYTLHGQAEAPLSESIIAVDCRSRTQDAVELMVPNIVSQDTTYFVSVDVPYCEGEAPTLVIPRASTRRYAIQVRPTVGGDYTGRVTFTAANGRYVWYAVQLHVDPPEKEGTVEMVTDVRTSMVAEVTVTNPLDAPLTFRVQRYGVGLYGANVFHLGAKAAATYGVLFVPTQAGESSGRLSLVSDVVGEFWYELRMKVTEAEPEPLPFATTPLGQQQVMQVHLPNRTAMGCALTVESTNPAAFMVTPARVTLPANSESVIDIVYVPNTVGVEQTAVVTLRNAELGCWRYACTGTGAPPLPAEPLRCSAAVGSTAVLTLPFVNPLHTDTALDVRLRNASTAFSLRAVPTGPVASGASSPITLAFTPSLVQRYDAVVEVRPLAAKTDPACNVVWTYPVEGLCEYRHTKPAVMLRCAARTQAEQTVYLHAPGLTPELADGVTLSFEADAQQAYGETAAASVACALTTPNPYPDGFEAQVRFTPLRPFIGAGWITLHGVLGGVWRYRVQFEATPAAPDDTITLHGEYKETTSATFDLYNVFPYRSPFFAYFAADSSRDLSVSPSHGVLLPFVPGQRVAVTATSLQITVRPSSRIPQVEGTLIVDTDDMQWIFRVVAKFGHQARPNS